jgi:hypothetical protein
MGVFVLIYKLESVYLNELNTESFDTEDRMHSRAEELYRIYGDSILEIILSAFVAKEWEYTPIEVVTKFKANEIKK